MLIPLLEFPRPHRRHAARFRSFEYLATSTADIGASQGVATVDGLTFWVAAGTAAVVDPDNSFLYKYTRSGNAFTLAVSRGTSADWPAGMTQINSVHYRNGVLYVGGNNYNTTPRKGWVLEYDPDDLTLLDTHAVEDHWCEGGAWRTDHIGEATNDEFWTCYANPAQTGPNTYEVSRYDSEFTLIDSYPLPVAYDSGTLFHEGLAWKGNLVFSMIHEGTTPLLAEVFRWNPLAAEFSLVQRLRPPTDECTQGIALAGDGSSVWWAERFHGGAPTQDSRVVQSRLHETKVPAGRPRIRQSSPQAQNLLAWYPLNNGAGAAVEIVAGTHNGTLSGGAAWINEPARGPCVSLDGSNAKVAISSALLSSPLTDITICGWFLVDALPDAVILLSGNAVGANAGDWHINVNADAGIRFAYNSTGTTLENLDSAEDMIRRGEWFHVAAALKSGGGGYAKIYVNGLEIAMSGTTGNAGGNGQEIRIGLQSNDNGDFTGKAHDVRFYNAALADSVIAAMSAPATMFQLWR